MNSKKSVKKHSKGSRLFLVFQDEELRTLNDLARYWKLNTQQTIRRVLTQYVRENK
jgi:hypothetical protein